jgi:integrase
MSKTRLRSCANCGHQRAAHQYGRGIHSLRHTAITNIYALTKDLRKAQVFAGHSSSAITERYAHIVDMAETLSAMPVLS